MKALAAIAAAVALSGCANSYYDESTPEGRYHARERDDHSVVTCEQPPGTSFTNVYAGHGYYQVIRSGDSVYVQRYGAPLR